mmetsp:Transcript_7145/g.10277  ORF Transcript_7145/g.10277 Transcript_7145/m.10277 type:complete len:537 (-) Transcript_7145:113-1723(-)
MRRRSASRSRSRPRATSESRQPEDEGRRRSTAHQYGGSANTNGVNANAYGGAQQASNNNNGGGCAPMQMSTPPRSNNVAGGSTANAYPTTPETYLGHGHHHIATAAPNTHPKFPRARCYRLNLEKPFDITKCVSPLGKNAGFSSRDYSGPIHEADLPPVQGPVEYYPPPHLATPSVGDLMANLQVSKSEESVSETTIAITTAEIFRGITVDRKTGLITGMNSRATRSRKDKGKNMQGEKSRQAAKIDKAKDLIDEVDENGDMMSNEENDPSKILSLLIMGEYEELNDLVLDGSKKLRDYKTQPDEVLVQMNRPRPLNYSQTSDNHSSHLNFPSSPANASMGSSLTSFSSRKRGFSKDRVRQKFNIMPKSAPPKIKPHSRDGPSKRLVGAGGSVNSPPVHSPNNYSSPRQPSYRAQPSSNNWGMDVDDNTDANFAHCNLKSDWHDIFFHNSLWNCGNVNAAATSSTPNQSPRNQGYNNGADNQSYNNGSQYSAYGAGAGGYYSRPNPNGYDEGRNPSGGYGYTRGNSNGVRDSTVVM